mgnify:CR=1 FL=1
MRNKLDQQTAARLIELMNHLAETNDASILPVKKPLVLVDSPDERSPNEFHFSEWDSFVEIYQYLVDENILPASSVDSNIEHIFQQWQKAQSLGFDARSFYLSLCQTDPSALYQVAPGVIISYPASLSWKDSLYARLEVTKAVDVLCEEDLDWIAALEQEIKRLGGNL